jgi:L-rhamnose mutarotase
MLRKAFVLQLKAGCEAEYVRRHNPIWPELAAVLKAHGVLQYSIHLHADTLQLFEYVEVEDELRWDEISSTAVCQRWWAHMAELMETHDDHRPKAIVLKEVFSLDSKT